jgi:hypothetical protein
MPLNYDASINAGKYPTVKYKARKSLLYLWLLRLCCCAPCPKIAKHVDSFSEDEYDSDSSNSSKPTCESDTD